MWRAEFIQMRFGLGSSLAAVLLACSIFSIGGRTEPVNLHAANAAEAADVAEQAATVAKRVAAHTEEVAHDTAQALRYTKEALKRAGADAADVAEVGRQADQLDAEAGITSSGGKSTARSASDLDKEGSVSINRGGSNSRSGSSGSAGSGSSVDGGLASGSSVGSSGRSGLGGGHGGPGAGGEDEGVGRSLDIDNAISPYPNGVEPFGQEEPAQQLTKESVKQSDGMIDQIENTQGVESKRAVYRALTKLRGATIASYDGMAKAHLKNVDHYNKGHKWREEHPMRHLAEEEADTDVWAFPKKTSSKSKAKAPAGKGNKPAAAPAPAK